MELRNIKSFIKVAEFENFSKAAEVLGYAQSTITLQIQQLEQELGVNLFDRIGKRVLLSEKGRAFLSYANDMVQLEAEAIETVSENTTPTGTLRIGTIESIASSFLPKYATLPILQEKNLALFTVAGFDIKMDLLIFYHRQKWVTPAMKYFTETAEEFFSPSVASNP